MGYNTIIISGGIYSDTSIHSPATKHLLGYMNQDHLLGGPGSQNLEFAN